MEIDLGTEGWVEFDVEDEEQYVSRCPSQSFLHGIKSDF